MYENKTIHQNYFLEGVEESHIHLHGINYTYLPQSFPLFPP